LNLSGANLDRGEKGMHGWHSRRNPMRRKDLFYLLIALCFLSTLDSGALAEEKYPTKEIKMIFPAPPGGFQDIAFRLISENLEKILGVRMIITHQTGSGGAAGTHYLVKSKPDGYTLGCISSAHLILLPATLPNVPYKYSDLDPLCKFASSPTVVFCKGDAPWKTLEELVADARKRPGEITYGATTNSISHLQMEGFLKDAGINMLHVPLSAVGQTITRILGGNLDIGVGALTPVVTQLKAGTLRALFLATQERVSIFPQIPTLDEKGYRKPLIILHSGFYAPVGVAKSTRETLEKAFEKTIKDPGLKKRLEEEGTILEHAPSEVFAKEIQEEYDRVTKFIRSAGPRK